MTRRLWNRWNVYWLAVAVLLLAASAPAQAVDQATVTLTVTDKVAGGTVRYIGGYNLHEALADPEAKKHLAGTEINCTKLWFTETRRWRMNGEFLGPDYKEIAIRQVTKFPETIRWDEELSFSTQAHDLASLEKHIALSRQFGAQVVMNFKIRLREDELRRRMYWRLVFLTNYYFNKVKDYKLTLWEFGCEDARQGPEQVEVGSDAVRESAKLTGVPVIVAGPGEDGAVDVDFRTILASDYAARLDALSFHSFQWPEDFPALGLPGTGERNWMHKPVKDVFSYFDGIQKQLRPDAPLLPYWDTGWTWKQGPGGRPDPTAPFAGMFPSNWDPRTPLAYIGRIIQQCENRGELNLYCRLYSTRPSSIGGATIEMKDGKLQASPVFYAMRMMARANAGDKERLVLEGKPDDAVMQALATRSAGQLFITCVSRTKDQTIRVTLNGLDRHKGKAYEVRRLDEKQHDEISSRGNVNGALVVDLPPLTAFQVVVDRQ